MATEITRASWDMMVHVQEIINSNGHLYAGIVAPRDAGEHHVTDEWADRNFKIREFYLLRDDDLGDFVATGSFQLLKNFAYIGYLYVRYGFHKRGYGRILIDHLERRAREAGIRDLRLFVNEKASWARIFYGKTGFQPFLSDEAEILDLDDGIMLPFYEEGALFLRKLLG